MPGNSLTSVCVPRLSRSTGPETGFDVYGYTPAVGRGHMCRDGRRFLTFRVPGVPRSIPEVRQSIRGLLQRAGIEPSKIEPAVSEAVTNAVQHGYRGAAGWVEIELSIDERTVNVVVRDYGAGFSTHPESGQLRTGLTLMESLSDRLEVEGGPGLGTTVRMEFALTPSDRRSLPL